MKKDGFISNFKYKLRKKAGYNVKNSYNRKSIYRKQFRNLILCMIIILIILIIKKVETEPTEKAINIVKATLNYNTSIKRDSNKVLNYVKRLFNESENVTTVFKSTETSDSVFISPVSGSIYQYFGEEKKSDNIRVFHKGIKIKTSDNMVKSIGNGVVVEIKENILYGKQIVIEYGDIQALYGFLEEIVVSEGITVEKGEVIGKTKSTSNNKNMLYLEILENNKPINPEEKINITEKNLVSK